jgi:CHAT domain-containing protein
MNIFKKVFNILLILPFFSQAQDISAQYEQAKNQFFAGEYSESILTLSTIAYEQCDSVEKMRIHGLNGLNYTQLRIDKKAEENYNKALLFLPDKQKNIISYCKILNNIGLLLKKQWRYREAVEHYLIAIQLVNESSLTNREKQTQIEYLYYNLGLVQYYLKNYKTAVSYYLKSLLLKEKFKLSGIDKAYFNLARAYSLTGEKDSSEIYYKKAIEYRIKKYGHDYFRLASVNMNYGIFLTEQKDYENAFGKLKESVRIYELNYGIQHPYTANSYKYLAACYTAEANHDSALYWYQKSLIACTYNFNSSALEENPNTNDGITQLQLLSSLQYKAAGIYNAAQTKEGKEQANYYALSIRTIDKALLLISKIRNDFSNKNSKYIITEEEKACISIAVKSSMALFHLTNNRYFAERAYLYASASKAGVSNTISKEEKNILREMPDSVISKKEMLEKSIAANNKLIYEESESLRPDSSRINILRSEMFQLSGSYDSLMADIKLTLKQQSKKPRNYLPVHEIQEQLPDHTTLLEYFIANDDLTNNSLFYAFIIHKEGFKAYESDKIDSLNLYLESFSKKMNSNSVTDTDLNEYNTFNKNLYELNKLLFKPLTRYTDDKNIIIIPDEAVAFVSFDALLADYKEAQSINYTALPFLIKEYCFSYGYSAHLLFREDETVFKDSVFAFAPKYKRENKIYGKLELDSLDKTKTEIEGIMNLFEGTEYNENNALKDSFLYLAQSGNILHLAGHAHNPEKESDFSFFAFSDNSDETDDHLLYAFEIENMPIESPMIVLSACNTGSGEIYNGEGVLSLSGSFLKAGASSVVHSIWNVKDFSGSEIMIQFYEELGKGKAKNHALRNAKLSYLSESWPTYNNPVYWAGYVLTGDVSPLIHKSYTFRYIFVFLAVLSGGVFIFYKRRKMN